MAVFRWYLLVCGVRIAISLDSQRKGKSDSKAHDIVTNQPGALIFSENRSAHGDVNVGEMTTDASSLRAFTHSGGQHTHLPLELGSGEDGMTSMSNQDSDTNPSTHTTAAMSRVTFRKTRQWNEDTSTVLNHVTSVYTTAHNLADISFKIPLTEAATSGDVDILDEKLDFPKFYFNLSYLGRKQEFSGIKGEIRGFVDGMNYRKMLYRKVRWTISVPRGMYIAVHLAMSTPCKHDFTVRIPHREQLFWETDLFGCLNQSVLLFSDSNSLNFSMKESDYFYENRIQLLSEYPQLTVRFEATQERLQYRPRVVYTAPTAGYLHTYGYDGKRRYASRLNGSYTLALPAGHHVMISFGHIVNSPTYHCSSRVDLLAIQDSGNTVMLWRECFDHVIPAQVYSVTLQIYYVIEELNSNVGLKMLFSYHPVPAVPRQMSSGLFDCSLTNFASFRQHLDCNLQLECKGGEDEGEHCPFSPPGCRGKVGYKNKCYRLMTSPEPVLWKEAEKKCREGGGDLAMMKNEGEWQAFRNLFRFGRTHPETFIGLTDYDSSMPAMYRFTYKWTDGTVLYDRSSYHVSKYMQTPARYSESQTDRIDLGQYVDTLHHYACQTVLPASDSVHPPVEFPLLPTASHSVKIRSRTFLACQAGHVTHDFLACDPLSHCGRKRPSPLCDLSYLDGQHTDAEMHTASAIVTDVTTSASKFATDNTTPDPLPVTNLVSMFACDKNTVMVPYTLLCDFRRNCEDGSDESFCRHRQCQADFTCNSGQCVDRQCHLRAMYNCLCIDCSDEGSCPVVNTQELYYTKLQVRLPPPALIHFHQTGYVTQHKLNTSQPCPQTYFRCPGEYNYCLPVFVRCNGVYDCADHEDEAECHNYTCPGFYRCRASRVCVHLDHLCDGFPQCPQRDDELLCDLTCPEGCRCQGLAFVCSQPFSANTFPELRYLDASGSGMAFENLTSNPYLVWLSLTACNIVYVPEIPMNNLKHLDLRHNRLTEVRLQFLSTMENLESLILNKNPLVYISIDGVNMTRISLKRVDLSNTLLQTFEGSIFQAFPRIEFLNISFSQIQKIGEHSFQYLPRLKEIDMREMPLREFHTDIFQGLSFLRQIQAGDYRLCCKQILPENFDNNYCFAPKDAISSCENLLGSEIFRVYLWTVGILAILGNGGCVFRRIISTEALKSSADMLVINLQVANFIMGVYSVLIAVVDRKLRGHFVFCQKTWTTSLICNVAGFLWLLSNQTSVFMLCLITLDRYLVLHSTRNRLIRQHSAGEAQYKQREVNMQKTGDGEMQNTKEQANKTISQKRCAVLVGFVTWGTATCLAVIPYLPMTSHWELRSQNSVCIPLVISAYDFNAQGRGYSFGVTFLLNLVLSLLISVGQCGIYRYVRKRCKYMVLTDPPPSVILSRCLISVALTDVLCWLPLGLLGLTVWAGHHDVTGLMDGLVYLVPINSAVNPFLYTFNVMKERQRAAEKARLLVLLKARLKLKSTRTTGTTQ